MSKLDIDNKNFPQELRQVLDAKLFELDQEPDEITKYVVINPREFSDQAVAAIQKLVLDMVGEDETTLGVESYMDSVRNYQRNEIRKQVQGVDHE